MTHKGKHSSKEPAASLPRARSADQLQVDFELDFFGRILHAHPDYIDVLRIMGNLLSLKGRHAEGLTIDQRLVRLRPRDPLAHYNLACSYALLNSPEQSLTTLRQAIELGYRDFRYMREDRDLDPIRQDPRFRQLMREYEDR